MRFLLTALLLLPGVALGEGMPQLDFRNPLTSSQIAWGAVIFIVLYILASRFALPRVGTVLQDRAERIANDLENARTAKTTADRTGAELAEASTKARAEAQAAINAALEQAKASAAAQAAQLNERLERQLKEAEGRIAESRASAMGTLRQVATEVAVTVVERLTGAPPDPARLDNAIQAVISGHGAD